MSEIPSEEPYQFQPAPCATKNAFPQFLLDLAFVLIVANLVHRLFY